MTRIYTPISLGNSCETKWQVSRFLLSIEDPDYSGLRYRLKMLPPDRGKEEFGWMLFDWQGTPFETVRHYLEQDFVGFLEREDLEIRDDSVFNSRWGTDHLHEFEPFLKQDRGPTTEQTVDEDYPAAKALHDRLAAEFRLHLERPGDFLYVHSCEDFPTRWPVERMLRLLGARSPEHRVSLLLVGLEGEDSDLSMFDNVSKAWRPKNSGKPEGRSWEGNDEAWDKALSAYNLAPIRLLERDD